jgi:general L-amino acid transport system permease protein
MPAMTIRLRDSGWAAQTALLVVTALLIALLAHNAAANMEARGLASGFAFLKRPAGFDISQSLIPYTPDASYARVYLVGALNTLLVAVLGIAGASVLGLVVGVARVSQNFLVRLIGTAYVEVVRNIPLAIQLLVWFSLFSLAPPPRRAFSLGNLVYLSNRGLYLPKPLWTEEGAAAAAAVSAAALLGLAFALWAGRRRKDGRPGPVPDWGWVIFVMGAGLALSVSGNPSGVELPRFAGFDYAGGVVLSPALAALWVALTVYTAAFIGEIIRGGVVSVAAGQSEAARSLGLSPRETLRLVVLPQAFRAIVPPLASQYLNLVKNSSLAVIVGYPDLVAVFGGTTLNQTGQAIECLALVMAFYLAVSLFISLLMNLWNARTGIWARRR